MRKAQSLRMPLSDAYVEAVHRGFGAVLDHELDRVGGGRYGIFHDRIHPREHVVRDGHTCGRRPIPIRTRTKSLPSLPMMERRPLCPPAPPPTLTRTVPASRSRSSWTTMRSKGL